LWLIGVVYARGMGSPWTIFFFIVMLLAPYKMLFSVALGCPGLFLAGWLICLLAGRRVVAFRALSCGRWCPFAFCGAFGLKETIDILMTKRGRWRI
jgi:hypothetical protein